MVIGGNASLSDAPLGIRISESHYNDMLAKYGISPLSMPYSTLKQYAENDAITNSSKMNDTHLTYNDTDYQGYNESFDTTTKFLQMLCTQIYQKNETIMEIGGINKSADSNLQAFILRRA
jgi:hypothetical protein